MNPFQSAPWRTSKRCESHLLVDRGHCRRTPKQAANNPRMPPLSQPTSSNEPHKTALTHADCPSRTSKRCESHLFAHRCRDRPRIHHMPKHDAATAAAIIPNNSPETIIYPATSPLIPPSCRLAYAPIALSPINTNKTAAMQYAT